MRVRTGSRERLTPEVVGGLGRRAYEDVDLVRERHGSRPGVRLLAEGSLTAAVAARLPLDRATEALPLAESGTVAGKVVLTPPP